MKEVIENIASFILISFYLRKVFWRKLTFTEQTIAMRNEPKVMRSTVASGMFLPMSQSR